MTAERARRSRRGRGARIEDLQREVASAPREKIATARVAMELVRRCGEQPRVQLLRTPLAAMRLRATISEDL
jgi:hypothetical protein